MSNRQKKLSIKMALIVPCYNEANYIHIFINEWMHVLKETNYKLIILNDGSTDNSKEVIEKLSSENDRIISVNKTNSGHGRTCRFGYEYALALKEFDYIVQIDSDGQCDPEYFPQFLELAQDNDVVFGIRTSRDDGFARRITSFLCTTVTSILTRCLIKDANVPYRMIKTDILKEALKSIPNDFNIQNVALTVALKRLPNISWGYVPMHFRDRTTGTNSINLLNIAHLGLKMISELRGIK